jgi:hypothetical protein
VLKGSDEGLGELEKAGQFAFDKVVMIIIFGRRCFEILFELTIRPEHEWSCRKAEVEIPTLNKFFSSLSDFSFLSLNLVYELLKRS